MNIKEYAYAKINLALDIIRKRDDGYHEVDMIMQTISLHDEVFFEEADEKISLSISGARLANDESNLVYRAARLLQQEAGINRGASIILKKHIPMEAGLAGGSADAAATLRGLNKLWRVGLSFDDLRMLSAKIGSDVAFCVAGGTARATGRGEVIEQLADMPSVDMVVFKPEFGISTAWAYGRYAELANTVKHPNIGALAAALENGCLPEMYNHFGNVLENVSVETYPQIAQIKHFLIQQGAMQAMMSGSGTAVFGIFRQDINFDDICRKMESSFSGRSYICYTKKYVKEM